MVVLGGGDVSYERGHHAVFLMGPQQFRALSGRLKFTVRRHKFNEDFLLFPDGGGRQAAGAQKMAERAARAAQKAQKAALLAEKVH